MQQAFEEKRNKDQGEDIASRTAFFAMIADPVRHAILVELLSKHEVSVSQLINKLRKPQTLVSYHLRCLRECGMVTREKSVKDRREWLYSLHEVVFVEKLFTMADDYLKKHEICKTHPACRITGNDP